MTKLYIAVFSFLGTAMVFCEAVVHCYWAAGSNSRNGVGRYGISDISTDLCDVIIYSFVIVGAEGEIIFDQGQTVLEGKSNKVEDFIALKENNTDLKLVLACGGGNAHSTNFTIVANNATLRATFVSNIVSYINDKGFDGLDMDWEFPNQKGGVESDKEAFVYLLQELKTAMNKINPKLKLSFAAGRNQTGIDKSYLVPNISDTVDYIHLMSYDYHAYWGNMTGVNSPLYRQLTDAVAVEENVNASVHTWLDAGADPKKLFLGMGSYGRSFTLKSTDDNDTGAPVSSTVGYPGPYTADAGSWSYYEICMSQQANSTWNVTEVEGNYVYGNLDTFWIGYDNVNTITAKATYANDLGLAGIFFWSMDLDDFSGQCGNTTYPLIRAAKTAFNAN